MILNSGPDEVKIFPEIESEDDYGDPIRYPSDTPVVIRTYVQALSAEESGELDVDPQTTRYFNTSRPLPGGAWARLEWGDRTWDMLGEPQHIGRSMRTAHTHVVMQAREPFAAPGVGA